MKSHRIYNLSRFLADVQESSFNQDCLALSSFEKLLKSCDSAALLRSPSHSVSKAIKCEDGGEVVRYIPTSLLVAGDHILLYPGQPAPANAILVEVRRSVFVCLFLVHSQSSWQSSAMTVRNIGFQLSVFMG